MAHIIVVAAQQRRDLRISLECEGHVVTEVSSAGEAVAETRTGSQDLLIVDSGIGDSGMGDSGCDLYDLCGMLRPESDLGIIVLIRDGMEQLRIGALNAGADDYIAEHFVHAELLARVRAVLRRVRKSPEDHGKILLHDRTIDLRSHKIHTSEGQVSSLTPKEYLVLKCLFAHANKPVTNRHLAREVWRREEDGDFEYVRTVMSQLRRKVERDSNHPRYIITERAAGYRFKHPVRPWQSDTLATVQSECIGAAEDPAQSSFSADLQTL